jgi:hypothetical protein
MNSILISTRKVYIYTHLNELYLEDNRTRFVAVVEDKLMLVGKVGEDR